MATKLHWLRPSAIALAIAALVPALTSAQGLGDAAAREKHKRKAAAQPAKVYDNQDLAERAPAKKDGASAPTDAAPPASAAPSLDDQAEQGEAAARRAAVTRAERDLREAEDRVASIQRRIQELQDMLNPMSPSFVYGAAKSGDAAGDEMRAREELERSGPLLAEAQQAVEAARKAVDEARTKPITAGGT